MVVAKLSLKLLNSHFWCWNSYFLKELYSFVYGTPNFSQELLFSKDLSSFFKKHYYNGSHLIRICTVFHSDLNIGMLQANRKKLSHITHCIQLEDASYALLSTIFQGFQCTALNIISLQWSIVNTRSKFMGLQFTSSK